ncbi:MAG: amidase, partial [bacterium]
MADLDLCYASATDLAAKVRNKVVSPVEVVRNALARLDEVEPFINAFVARDDERALAAAAEAEAAIM